MASKMAAETDNLISPTVWQIKKILSAKHTFLWSRNALETKLITICCPITKFAEIFKMASKMAAEKRKLNISYCMAEKAEMPSTKHTFLWSMNAIETS